MNDRLAGMWKKVVWPSG